jgi:hypothetical protein
MGGFCSLCCMVTACQPRPLCEHAQSLVRQHVDTVSSAWSVLVGAKWWRLHLGAYQHDGREPMRVRSSGAAPSPESALASRASCV